MARFDADALVEETLSELSGHTLDQEQFTWLSAPVDASTTTIPVADQTQVRRGLTEIGDELVQVASTEASGDLILAPFGRGVQGSTAESHAVNTKVVYGPTFPRFRIKNKINDIVRTVFPTIFVVDTHTFSATSPAYVTYELPADVDDVLTVKQDSLGPSRDWRMLQNWRFDRTADTDDFTNGRTIDIWEPLTPGRDVQVVYMKRPSEMVDEWADTGLNNSAWPAIKYGVLHQMIAVQEAGLSGVHAVKASEAQRQNSPAALSREYYAIHQQLLQEERMRLLADFEVTNNFQVF